MSLDNLNQVVVENSQAELTLASGDVGLQLELRNKLDGAIVFCFNISGRITWRRDNVLLSSSELSEILIESDENCCRWSALLGPLRIICSTTLLQETIGYQESLFVSNESDEPVTIEDLSFGPTQQICNANGNIFEECKSDRWTAVPFGKLTGRPRFHKADFSIDDILTLRGTVPRICDVERPCGSSPGNGWFSEGWFCQKDTFSYMVSHFNQECMSMGRLEPQAHHSGVDLCFGGFAMWLDGPNCLRSFEPGERLNLGTVSYEVITGGYEKACRCFREFLSENHCHFPDNFDPPVHWNEIYDTAEWHGLSSPDPKKRRSAKSRKKTYTRDIMLAEASKGSAYSCDALYCDPGWDSSFGSYKWGEEWLGDIDSFITTLGSQYGMGLSLHVCLPAWLCTESAVENRGVDLSEWPDDVFMINEDGTKNKKKICSESEQFLDEAANRLIYLAQKGVRFFMFDGNWYPGECFSSTHGHSVPYSYEDHVAANFELVRRIHRQCPDVLIELHPTLSTAEHLFTPIYYGYGLEGCHDTLWGYELMWHPLDYLKSGEALALFYHALSCDIPLYLNVDIRDDNEHCIALWWAASTVRHLCIGGIHPDTSIAQRQKDVMKTYKRLERFFKRGEFVSNDPEIHAHVIPNENRVVVNLFNLSDEERVISGSFSVEELGIDENIWYRVNPGFTCQPAGYFHEGQLHVAKRLPPWGCFMYEITPFLE